jgi:tRNA threonylcarbamoyladenosine biosynthesis protein TsaE
MVTFTSHSVAETLSLGAAWGREARAGWVIGLAGELGAGKTQLVKGVAQGLGVTERVHSPTFTLVNEYRSGRLPLFHLDFYRLDTWAQFRSAGLEGYLYEPSGVTVIEWFDRCQCWITDGLLASPPGRLRRVVIGTFEESGLGPAGGLDDHEPMRSAGFSPQGRPSVNERSCGLKSALPGHFTESGRLIQYEDSCA